MVIEVVMTECFHPVYMCTESYSSNRLGDIFGLLGFIESVLDQGVVMVNDKIKTLHTARGTTSCG